MYLNLIIYHQQSETVTTEVVVKTEETETTENTTTIVVPQPEEKTVVQVTTTQETVTVEKTVDVEGNGSLEEEVKLEEKENAENNTSGTQKADLHIVINQEPSSAEVQQNMVAEEIKKENNLLKAILVTVFCCLPLGIVAIIQANKVCFIFLSILFFYERFYYIRQKQLQGNFYVVA
ncbi:uncharacterized protein LOC128250329 [Octopus bimaculoides]|uniref:uncharacterized protein LOC128250329 n=1 Tax=Octopus bimaculoides TaxID=37653 RepID=UPI0022E7AAC5|nr:uncharacterized protein LOC128250329 [Octopus bimaculoides]